VVVLGVAIYQLTKSWCRLFAGPLCTLDTKRLAKRLQGCILLIIMFKKAIYRKALSKNGLFTLSLVFSLFAFPGLINTAEASRPQPQHIEVVADVKDVAEPTVFPYQITDLKLSTNSLQSTREHECNVQLVYQRQVKETLDTILKHSYTYSPPNLFWIVKVISSLRDDNPPLI